jgi:transcription elongation factor GreB
VSKPFTKDDASDASLIIAARPPLPDGVTNYVTSRGLALLKEELSRLQLERARLESWLTDSDAPRELATASLRVAELEERLGRAHLVDLYG